ncbi:LysR family transcriptional regulator [Leifsonia sp. EB34]|uniref:LysR family transcriptional regulator n=1 Tax=Leifsonia sp. EB34 TaxID=3156303 RepID=UPI0035158796
MQRLRVFRSVVASGSVQAAAVSLGYTPSAVSQHLAVLQRETGLGLFERVGRGLRPTAAGLALSAEAAEILAHLDAVDARIAELRTGRTSSVSIDYFASVGEAWLPSVVRELNEKQPDVRVALRLTDNPSADPEHRADIQLLVRKGGVEPWAGFDTHHLRDDPYVLVVPDSHRFAARTEVALPELAGERLIDNDFSHGWCRRILVDACVAAGFTPTFHIEAHDYRAALAFVAADLGVTVLPSLGATSCPDGATIVPLAHPAPVRSIYAVAPPAEQHTPGVATALHALRRIASVA